MFIRTRTARHSHPVSRPASLFLLAGFVLWLNAPALANGPTVAIVRSDDPELPQQFDPGQTLSYEAIRDMVARATDLGGLEAVIREAEAKRSPG